jgi:hypothetical protein
MYQMRVNPSYSNIGLGFSGTRLGHSRGNTAMRMPPRPRATVVIIHMMKYSGIKDRVAPLVRVQEPLDLLGGLCARMIKTWRWVLHKK